MRKSDLRDGKASQESEGCISLFYLKPGWVRRHITWPGEEGKRGGRSKDSEEDSVRGDDAGWTGTVLERAASQSRNSVWRI